MFRGRALFVSMPTTSTDIANLALSHLGATTITDIAAGTSKEARTMNTHYAQARRETLRARRWSCAIKRAALVKSGTQPTAGLGFTISHDLPADFLRLLELNGDDLPGWADSYAIENGAILSDTDPLWIRYTFDQTDPDKWDPLLIDAVAMLLAAKAARSLTGSENLESQLRQQYERLTLPKAATADGQQDGSNENNPLLKLIAKSAGNRFRRMGDVHGLYRDNIP